MLPVVGDGEEVAQDQQRQDRPGRLPAGSTRANAATAIEPVPLTAVLAKPIATTPRASSVQSSADATPARAAPVRLSASAGHLDDQQVDDGTGSHRAPEVEALPEVAVHVAEPVELRRALDALRDGAQPEVVREVDDRGDQEAALLAVTELADELLVDLEYVDRAGAAS